MMLAKAKEYNRVRQRRGDRPQPRPQLRPQPRLQPLSARRLAHRLARRPAHRPARTIHNVTIPSKNWRGVTTSPVSFVHGYRAARLVEHHGFNRNSFLSIK